MKKLSTEQKTIKTISNIRIYPNHKDFIKL